MREGGLPAVIAGERIAVVQPVRIVTLAAFWMVHRTMLYALAAHKAAEG